MPNTRPGLTLPTQALPAVHGSFWLEVDQSAFHRSPCRTSTHNVLHFLTLCFLQGGGGGVAADLANEGLRRALKDPPQRDGQAGSWKKHEGKRQDGTGGASLPNLLSPYRLTLAPSLRKVPILSPVQRGCPRSCCNPSVPSVSLTIPRAVKLRPSRYRGHPTTIPQSDFFMPLLSLDYQASRGTDTTSDYRA
ncbi:hypothetical protein BDP55DRAFT_637000 [Colletotrichum godetiae]|uniref:Uncharacterized protein n=1 Tax=Colletotrichum godetiae TaxID=1209918 RepID=A0AAJ0ABD1_9PEZI|nr:uncharacterized protein BDP55DRAFT_637000 [Colletotrichum godetiae]KAK1659378.1 hypothetical protein BDP55DRAFT_637000 [Colletotrichum godetiae]